MRLASAARAMRSAGAMVVALVGCQSSDVSRTLGARCDLSSDCAQRCLPPSTDWPGGFCTTTCDSDASCATGARCIDEVGGVCAFECTTDPDCAFLGTGYTCKPIEAQPAGFQVMVCHG